MELYNAQSKTHFLKDVTVILVRHQRGVVAQVVSSVPCIRKVAGSNLTLAAT